MDLLGNNLLVSHCFNKPYNDCFIELLAIKMRCDLNFNPTLIILPINVGPRETYN